MRKFFCLLMSIVTCFLFTACNSNASGNENGGGVGKVEEKALKVVEKYSSGKEFMIKGWLMPNTNTLESYKLVKELGITHVMIDSGTGVAFGTQQFEDVMKYMEEAGVNGIFTLGNGDRATEPYDGMDQDFRKWPAIKGINYFDEPRGSEQNTVIFNMIKAHEEKYGNDLFAYTNLFPYSVYNEKYNDYVKNYCEDVLSKISGRKILAMDVYPYYYGDKLIESTWIAGLETIGKYARDYGLEMQIWIQSMENLSLGTNSLRKPIKEEYAHQIYSALAFGAKGFGYFTLGTGLAPGWGEALIKKDGTASESYFWAKEINAEVCSFQDVYLSFNYEKTLAVDGEKSANQCINFMYMDARPTLDGISNISAKEDALIGQFENGGQKAYMITNFAEPMLGKKNTVSMTFTNANAVVVYVNGKSSVYRLIDGKAVFNLNIGEGVFAIPVNV